MAYKYFTTIEEIIDIHRKTVAVSGGGSMGIISLHSLECAIEQIQYDDYYPEFEDKLTHLFWVANKSHCFQDGNKRIAITACSMFLLMNGYLSVAKDFLYRMESISYHVAAGNIDKILLHEIITSILYEDDYSESLKLKIFDAFSKNSIDNE
ncbi:MAG: type II toxin-antitoxin system death-on-curing family toxin [Bacteroidota bacterium]